MPLWRHQTHPDHFESLPYCRLRSERRTRITIFWIGLKHLQTFMFWQAVDPWESRYKKEPCKTKTLERDCQEGKCNFQELSRSKRLFQLSPFDTFKKTQIVISPRQVVGSSHPDIGGNWCSKNTMETSYYRGSLIWKPLGMKKLGE